MGFDEASQSGKAACLASDWQDEEPMKHKPSNWLFSSGLPFVALLAVGSAEGALLQSSGPSTTVAFDSTLTSASLIYDANYYSATEGRLVIVASGSSLAGPGVTGGPAQTYLGAGDSLKDLALTLRLRNTDGALVSGSVNLPGDNNSAADSWTMAGSVTAFGWSDYVAAGTNTFDLRWGVNSYDFSDVSANPASGIASGSESGWGVNYGIGAEYMFSTNVSAVLQYDEYRLKFAGQGRDKIATTSLGIRYNF
jgi:hypothetical protein